MSSGATARPTHRAAGGSIIVCPWKVVQLTTHTYTRSHNGYNHFFVWIWVTARAHRGNSDEANVAGRHMFKGHPRKSITAKTKMNCLCHKDSDGEKESDSWSSSIFYCLSPHLPLKKLFWNLQLKKKENKRCSKALKLNFNVGLWATIAETLWVCPVIVDVFSQHGCLIIKSLSKFVKALSFWCSGWEARAAVRVHLHVCAHTSQRRCGFYFCAHINKNTICC